MPATPGKAHSSGRDYLGLTSAGFATQQASRARRSTSSQSAMRCVLSHSIPKVPRGLQASSVSPIGKYNQPSAETVGV